MATYLALPLYFNQKDAIKENTASLLPKLAFSSKIPVQ